MIGTASYRYVTDLIAEIQDLGDEALTPLLCVRENLLISDINPREMFRRNLYAMLDNTYAYIATRHTIPSTTTIGFVQSLNNHVLRLYGDQYGYETMDQFLIDQYLQVPQTFGDISNWIGYKITEIGDKAANWIDIDDDWTDVDIDWDLIGWENI